MEEEERKMKSTQKMYLEVVILSEVSQTEEDKYHTVLLVYKQDLKNRTNEPIYKTEIRVIDVENIMSSLMQKLEFKISSLLSNYGHSIVFCIM